MNVKISDNGNGNLPGQFHHAVEQPPWRLPVLQGQVGNAGSSRGVHDVPPVLEAAGAAAGRVAAGAGIAGAR